MYNPPFRKLLTSKQTYIILFFLIIGFIYRFYLTSLATDKLLWDAAAYSQFAQEILKGKLVADCCGHNLGYSMFLAVIYLFFGIENILAVRIIQIIIDLLVALFIFLIGQKIFNKRAGLLAFVLYILNPFTSSYTGILLPETITLFYIGLVGFIITRSTFRKQSILWLILGFILGLLVFTRAQFFHFSLVFIPILSFMFKKTLGKLFFITLALVGFLTVSIYSLVASYHHFKVLTLTPPYKAFSAALYQSFYTGRYPEVEAKFNLGTEDVVEVEKEYYKAIKSFTEFKKFQRKYSVLFWQKFKKEWPLFIKKTTLNMFWIWDKRNLFYYYDPFYPQDTGPLRVINMIFILLFLIGFVRFVKKEGKKAMKDPLAIFTLLLFLNIISFAFVSNETRHSLPFYGIIMLWGGYALDNLLSLR